MSRRDLLMAAVPAILLTPRSKAMDFKENQFKTRGVVIYPEDLSLSDWPERAARAGLSTLAIHHGSAPSQIIRFVRTDKGQKFLELCESLGLQVEYELHAMKELLPRGIFANNPELFRMNGKGDRTPDANLCVHSARALDIVAENALQIAKLLRPTTGRYFLWGDDGAEWCRCGSCRPFSDSDQALILENHLAAQLRSQDPRASLAHLAYASTIVPPTQVKPAPHVFLEFAPIHRRYDVPYAEQTHERDGLSALEANLRVFRKDTAQALEYWLDMSRFSGWKRPVPIIPWNRNVFEKDLDAYAQLGIQNITSFAAWVDAEYMELHHDMTFLDEYGQGLARRRR